MSMWLAIYECSIHSNENSITNKSHLCLLWHIVQHKYLVGCRVFEAVVITMNNYWATRVLIWYPFI